MRCGTTVGPILASKLGIQTVDVGCPQLAMHSVRELMHVNSICQAIKLYSVCFAKFQTLKLKLSDCFKGCTTASYEVMIVFSDLLCSTAISSENPALIASNISVFA